MQPPTKVEMDGIVNWDRVKEFEKLPREIFYSIPEHQRCGAWTMIASIRSIFEETGNETLKKNNS